jgi:glycosyltransferase involved in cell wall biosynthesis
MSNALIEAIAYGRIVVVSDIAANRAVVGDDYPLTFSVGDVEGLRDVLQRAFNDKELRDDALGKLRIRLSAFSVDSVTERLERILIDADRARN